MRANLLYLWDMESKIAKLRDLLLSRGWDAVVLTGSDPHSSEYPAECWKQVQALTGFTAECGDFVLTRDHAGVWTDTRYFIQANKQLAGTGVELHKMRVPEQVPIPEWLADQFLGQDEAIIAIDGLCVSASFAAEIEGALLQNGVKCNFVSIPNMLSLIWEDRPGLPQTSVFTVYSGESREQRLGRLREFMASKGCSACLVSALDEIAWLLNVRASDIEYNPFVISYLIVEESNAYFYVLKGPVEDPATEAAFDELGADGIELRPYDEIDQALQSREGRLMIDSCVLNKHLFDIATKEAYLDCPSPVQLWKAVKNSVEIAGIKDAHYADGLAMEQFLFWLEKSIANDKTLSEWDASVKLGALRGAAPEYLGDSFETISAYGPGGALPHYHTPHTGAPMLEAHGLYLCDSGAHYYSRASFGGTTDITRTVPLGPCTPLEMEDYTLVLKAHIGLAMAVFPLGTPGCRIDALAREALWMYKRNFGHGTGHGVGWFSGVHEGPQDIRQSLNPAGLVPGMVVSNEPAIYREGQFGIRHENLMLCADAGTNEFGHWCRFEPLTICHIDTSLVVKELLSPAEKQWLNDYNAFVFATLAAVLPPAVADWLQEKTRPID